VFGLVDACWEVELRERVYVWLMYTAEREGKGRDELDINILIGELRKSDERASGYYRRSDSSWDSKHNIHRRCSSKVQIPRQRDITQTYCSDERLRFKSKKTAGIKFAVKAIMK
jgi:hypothetical protein